MHGGCGVSVVQGCAPTRGFHAYGQLGVCQGKKQGRVSGELQYISMKGVGVGRGRVSAPGGRAGR